MTQKSGFVIAIDGPAASGKSTTAKKVAEKLNLLYIDTGAMYRAATYLAVKNGINLDEQDLVTEAVRQNEITQENRAGITHTCVNGEDVSDVIRSRNVTLHVSKIASNAGVRSLMVQQQQYMGSHGDVVLDGRDIGTVVFPDADLKIFMVASVEERAKRRLMEFEAKGETISLKQVIDDIKARDLQDEMRSTGPLKRAKDAILIDTSKMKIDEQVNLIIKHYNTIQQTFKG